MEKINPMTFVTDHDPVPEQVLDASSWFETEYLTLKMGGSGSDVGSYEMIGWYLAQGWVTYDKTAGVDVVDGLNMYYTIYSMRRRKLQAERALNDLIREFTEAYNEGRTLNDQRYDEILLIFNAMLDQSENEAVHNALYLTNFRDNSELLLAPIASDINEYDAQVTAALEAYTASSDGLDTLANEIATAGPILDALAAEVAGLNNDIDSLSAMLPSVESEVSGSVATLDSISTGIDDLAGDIQAAITKLEDFDTDLPAAKVELRADIAANISEFDAASGALGLGYDEFAVTSATILEGFGSGARARINAAFDARLSKSQQELSNRGAYNTTLWSSVAAGIERERAIALSDLEDKIAQQRVSINTGVYDRLARIKQSELDAKARKSALVASLHEQLFRFHDQKLRVSQETGNIRNSKTQLSQIRLAIHDQVLKVNSQRLRVHEQYMRLQDQSMKVVGQKLQVQDQRMKVADQQMRVRLTQLDAKAKVVAILGQLYENNSTFRIKLFDAKARIQEQVTNGTMTLVAARNAILTAMLGFMERRTDEYPGLGELASIASQMGFSEGAAVAPPT